MSRTRIKICGITRIEDAETAILAGADAIGFVFYEKSPRYISINDAEDIAKNCAPFINFVGLFVDADESYVKEVLDRVAIGTLQFHGQESEQTCASFNKPYIKAIRMTKEIDLVEECQRYNSAAGLLLDTYVKDVPGGTGMAFNWDLIPSELEKPIILAGGLDETNVKEAIHRVQPYAVDVSGGVEKEKGIKDPVKIKNFISEAMHA
ncbi:MAG: phosphoribosylanthranilate isomerase [Gammaproteobacteria bacterium]|jgi:phosphoribosylanthranilate isomerase